MHKMVKLNQVLLHLKDAGDAMASKLMGTRVHKRGLVCKRSDPSSGLLSTDQHDVNLKIYSMLEGLYTSILHRK